MFRRVAYIVAAGRTPIGTINGGLSSFSAPELAALTIDPLFAKCIDVNKEDIDELIYGNVLQANIGQNPTNQRSQQLGGLSFNQPN